MSWKLRAAMSALLLAPQAAWALGLGDIRLNSALNEPLSAEIELVAPTADELSTLSAQLASRDLFQRYGLDRPAYLDSVSFSVGRGRDGRSVLLMSSSAPVAEPFVTFLVEVNWPRGRLLREYTVLLDPPVFAATPAAPPAPVAAPRATAPAAPPPAPRPAPAPDRLPAMPAADGSYEVRPGDTLSLIARQMTDGDRAAANRMMVALFRANPQAFAGNMNVLRAGAMLRVPGADELQAIGGAEAASEIGRQASEWRAGEAAAMPARLRLVAPQDAPSEPLPADAGADAIQARIDSINREIGDSRRLLELRNAELAELQERLARERAAAAAPPPAVAEAPIAEAPVAGEPVAEAPVTEAPPPAAEPAPRPERPPAAAPADRTFLDSVTGNWTYVLGAAALLLGGGLAFGYARRRREQDLDEALRNFEPSAGAPVPSETARLRALALGEDEEENARPASAMEVREVAVPSARGAAAPRAARPEDTLSAEAPVDFDQSDALAEADFHMAYGLYDQAADIVKLALDRDPGRRDLQMKLIEVHFVAGNKARFLDAARAFDQARGPADKAEWDRVVIMGRQLAPEDVLFAGAALASGVDLNLEGGENRVDLELLGPPIGDEGVDLDLGEALAGVSSDAETGENELIDLDLTDVEPATAEVPRLDSTAEMPTVELVGGDAPTVEATRLELGADDTLRSKLARAGDTVSQPGVEATAEMSVDDLGIDLGDLPELTEDDDLTAVAVRGEPDDERTAIAPHAGADSEATRIAPSGLRAAGEPDVDLGGTSVLPGLDAGMDFDLGDLPGRSQAEVETGTDLDATAVREFTVDMDVGTALQGVPDELSSTGTARLDMDDLPGISSLEPVTMSEVGTKLDLARAYVDMGDPEGARSILEEVLKEGSTSQRAEAQRLIEGLPGA